MEATTAPTDNKLASTITPKALASAVRSGNWRIAGSLAFLKEQYGLASNAEVSRPLILGVVLKDHQLEFRTERKTFSFHVNDVRLDRPAPDIITIGCINEVSEQRRQKYGGGTELVRRIRKVVTLQRIKE